MARSTLILGTAFPAMILGCVLAAGCFDDSATDPSLVSSQSYQGHDNDADSNYLVRGYPALVGTRLDDCQTCHTAGSVEKISQGQQSTVELNPCSYCHLIPYPDETIVSGAPADYDQSLNPFGTAYRDAGRSVAAVLGISGEDSDQDGYTNDVELRVLRYPGDPASRPGQPIAPQFTFARVNLEALAQHEQFLLLNSHKQQFDTYATYAGVKVTDILAAAGADLASATSISFIAPDGYTKDFEVQEVQQQFPSGIYVAGLDPGSFANPERGFVEYPPADQMPPGLVDGGEIPGEQWMIVAYRRDGADLDTSYLDPVTGRLEGEGPYRLIVPQGIYGTPGSPDRGSRFSPSGFDDGYDYDDNKDHNAGLCIRGLVAIRVNPLPEETEEYDWKNGGFSLLQNSRLIVYGAGISGN